jgi:hypothetical protein
MDERMLLIVGAGFLKLVPFNSIFNITGLRLGPRLALGGVITTARDNCMETRLASRKPTACRPIPTLHRVFAKRGFLFHLLVVHSSRLRP